VEQKQKKKKHEKKLVVKRTDFKPLAMSEDEIAESRKMLEAMAKHEEEVQAINQIKNELEAAIYGSRDKLERDDIMKVSTEEQREEVVKLCTEYEEWMYEGATDKAEYDSRFSKLKDVLGPLEERALELEAREDLPDKIKEAVDAMNKQAADVKKNKTWVNETKLESAVSKITEFEEWWSKKQESQKALPLYEAPAYTKAEVTEKLSKLQKDWDTKFKAATKKPKEPKKPKAASNATSSEEAKEPKEEAKEEVLPEDAAEVEKLLEEVRTKKAAAVEAEDFDAAHALKSKEEKLKKQLEKLQKGSEL